MLKLFNQNKVNYINLNLIKKAMIKARVDLNQYEMKNGEKLYKAEITTGAGTHEIKVKDSALKKHPEKFICSSNGNKQIQ